MTRLLGTHRDNALDKARKGRGRKPKFDRQRIRDLRRQGMGIRAIARAVGCSTPCVYDALACPTIADT